MTTDWKNYELVLEATDRKECEDAHKPFFVHTMTDDGVTSDYTDAKEAYKSK